MAKQAYEKGDDGFLPGAIQLSADTYCRVDTLGAPITCKKILEGIRYRNIRMLVARAQEDKVMNRAEAGDRGQPYFDLATVCDRNLIVDTCRTPTTWTPNAT